MKRPLAYLLPALFVSANVAAQQADVTFFVIGKHANYSQDRAGGLQSVDFSFFSEIFLTSAGDAGEATLRFPTGELVPYRDMREAEGGNRDNLLLVAGADRYESLTDLQARYPDGNYEVSFETPSGSVADGVLTFEERPLPNPPVISLAQAGKSGCSVVMPGRDLEVSWSAFAGGRSDPNGILDDLVFVILADADGVRIAHSGRPFENKPYLTYAADSFTIDGEVLEPGQTYTLSVEHALLDDTTRFDNVPAFTTRAVTTSLKVRSGSKDMASCSVAGAPLTSSVTMFYYKDIEPAARFYGEILGLENYLDWDWVQFYKTGPASYVGLVTEGEGAWHKVREKNSVMLSLVSDDVDGWYERLRESGEVTFLKDVGNGGPIRSFLLEDPGGYTVEFFQWLQKPE